MRRPLRRGDLAAKTRHIGGSARTRGLVIRGTQVIGLLGEGRVFARQCGGGALGLSKFVSKDSQAFLITVALVCGADDSGLLRQGQTR